MNSTEISIEIVSSNNLEDLVKLALELWSDCSFDEEMESYTEVINSSDQICYLYKINQDYVAFIHVSTRYDYVKGANASPVAYVEGIYVQPAFRGEGVAYELIKRAEAWASNKGYSQLASDTEIGNTDSVEFHKRVGFNEVGRVVCFIKSLK